MLIVTNHGSFTNTFFRFCCQIIFFVSNEAIYMIPASGGKVYHSSFLYKVYDSSFWYKVQYLIPASGIVQSISFQLLVQSI